MNIYYYLVAWRSEPSADAVVYEGATETIFVTIVKGLILRDSAVTAVGKYNTLLETSRWSSLECAVQCSKAEYNIENPTIELGELEVNISEMAATYDRYKEQVKNEVIKEGTRFGLKLARIHQTDTVLEAISKEAKKRALRELRGLKNT